MGTQRRIFMQIMWIYRGGYANGTEKPQLFEAFGLYPGGIGALLELAADLKAKKKAGIAHDGLRGKNIALIFGKDLYPHPVPALRWRRMTWRMQAAPTLDPSGSRDKQKGVHCGYCPGARPDV